MNDLDAIRTHVDFLLQRARKPGLSKDERQQISAEVNQLWTKLATLTPAQEDACEETQGESSTQEEEDHTVRFVM